MQDFRVFVNFHEGLEIFAHRGAEQEPPSLEHGHRLHDRMA
jgi:hypothetical protein